MVVVIECKGVSAAGLSFSVAAIAIYLCICQPLLQNYQQVVAIKMDRHTTNTYVGDQFTADSDSVEPEIALVPHSWLTPLKSEVFWPPYRNPVTRDRAIKKCEEPVNGKWSLYKISRIFFQCADYEKSQHKLRKLEDSSDLQTTDAELSIRRKRYIPKRILQSDTESDTELPRPPKISRKAASFETFEVSKTPPGFNNIEVTPEYTPRTSVSHSQNITNCNQVYGNGEPTFITYTPTSSICSGDQEQQRTHNITLDLQKLIKEVMQLKEQNKQILAYLEKQSQTVVTTVNSLPRDFPVDLPLNDFGNIQVVENYLEDIDNFTKLVSYLSSLGGKDVTAMTNNILRKILTNELGCMYSFWGKRSNKRPFADLKLKSSVVDAVKFRFSQATEKDINDVLKVWL